MKRAARSSPRSSTAWPKTEERLLALQGLRSTCGRALFTLTAMGKKQSTTRFAIRSIRCRSQAQAVWAYGRQTGLRTSSKQRGLRLRNWMLSSPYW